MSERITPDDEAGEGAPTKAESTKAESTKAQSTKAQSTKAQSTKTEVRGARGDSGPVRAKPSRTNIALPTALIVIGAAALLIAWGTLQDKHGSSTASAASVSPTGNTSPNPSASSRSPGGSVTPSNSATPSKSASPSKSPSATATTPAPTTTASLADAQKIAVLVRNATTRKGLAAATGVRLKSKGWTVRDVANWNGKPITKTTIYYPAGKIEEARRLELYVKGDVVLVEAPAGLPQGIFVVVLGDNYPS